MLVRRFASIRPASWEVLTLSRACLCLISHRVPLLMCAGSYVLRRRCQASVPLVFMLTLVFLGVGLAMRPAAAPSASSRTATSRPAASSGYLPSTMAITPEYERTLQRVVVSMAGRDTTLKLHDDLLARLPNYTQIAMLIDRDNVATIRAALCQRSYGDRTTIVPYDSHAQPGRTYYLLFRDKDKLVRVDAQQDVPTPRFGTLWAQDLFEVAQDKAGRSILLTSAVHRYFSGVKTRADHTVMPDNLHLSHLDSLGLTVQTTPLAFKGGNVLVDRIGGRHVAFCGGDTLRTTKTAAHALTGHVPTSAEVKAVIGDALNVHQVVVVQPDLLQPAHMYHLDQAMVLLPQRVAAVTRVVGDLPENQAEARAIAGVTQYLERVRRALIELGYELVDIETSVGNVLGYQHYVNMIPYVHRETGQRAVLMPVFARATSAYDRSLIDRNTATLASLGYDVVEVPTTADDLAGGIHCLINVLE